MLRTKDHKAVTITNNLLHVRQTNKRGREGKVKPLLAWCRQQQDIYSQRLEQGVAFHLETQYHQSNNCHSLACGGPHVTAHFPRVFMSVGRQMTRGKCSHLHTKSNVPFPSLTSGALHMEILAFTYWSLDQCHL